MERTDLKDGSARSEGHMAKHQASRCVKNDRGGTGSSWGPAVTQEETSDGTCSPGDRGVGKTNLRYGTGESSPEQIRTYVEMDYMINTSVSNQ